MSSYTGARALATYRKRSSKEIRAERPVGVRLSQQPLAAPDLDGVRLWINQVSRTRLLTPEEEHEFAVAARNGCVESQRILIESNLRLVIAVAKKYRSSSMSFQDIIQEGNLGLIRATEKFDPEMGTRFSTYAIWWIRQAINRAVSEQCRTIRLPAHMSTLAAKVAQASAWLRSELGREPRADELATYLSLSTDSIHAVWHAVCEPLSLESQSTNANGVGLGDMLEDPDSESANEVVERLALHDRIMDAVSDLLPRERQVIKMRYGLENGRVFTLEEIASRLRITRERVRQVEFQAMKRLRSTSICQKLKDSTDA